MRAATVQSVALICEYTLNVYDPDSIDKAKWQCQEQTQGWEQVWLGT